MPFITQKAWPSSARGPSFWYQDHTYNPLSVPGAGEVKDRDEIQNTLNSELYLTSVVSSSSRSQDHRLPAQQQSRTWAYGLNSQGPFALGRRSQTTAEGATTSLRKWVKWDRGTAIPRTLFPLLPGWPS